MDPRNGQELGGALQGISSGRATRYHRRDHRPDPAGEADPCVCWSGSVNRTLKPAQMRKGLDQLVGKPVDVASTREDALSSLLMLERRARELEVGNPYQKSFTRFRTELCWTRDESRAGRVALIPDYPYLREVDDMLITKSPLFLTKSRRMLISWEVMAFSLWILAGGQDPRWVDGQGVPVLLHSTENRKVILASRKLEGENGSAEMLGERLRFLVDRFEEKGGREKWPDFPTFRWKFDRCVASNGSVCAALPQGSEQLRGSGITLGVLDEFAHWTEARSSLVSALQTLQGGGHLVLVGTANRDSYAALIAMDKVA